MDTLMNYEEFKAYITEHIKEYLPERFENASVSMERMVKNNDTVLDGLRIMEEGPTISPIIYINAEYESYQSGKDVNKVVADLADCYIEHISPSEVLDLDFNVENLMDYDSIKDKITCRLVSQESNSERLSQMPFAPMEDLAVTYHIQVSNGSDGISSIPINQGLMKNYKVDLATLHEQAMTNMERISPTVIKPLGDIVSEMFIRDFMQDNNMEENMARDMLEDMKTSDVPDILVVTNECGINGANCIANPEIQQRIGEKVGGDFFILPSSIHETLILPKTTDMDFSELQDMVQSVNGSVVSAEDKLSDYVYEYDAKEHTFSRADKAYQQIEKMVSEPNLSYKQKEKDSSHTEELKIEPPKHSSHIH